MNRHQFVGIIKNNLLRLVGKKLVRKSFRNKMIPAVITVMGIDLSAMTVNFVTPNGDTGETRSVGMLAEYKELP